MARSNAARAAKSSPPAAPAEKPAERPALAGVRGAAAAGTAPDLDQLIHERVRLGIVSALAVNESLSFTELKALLQASDGNLSVHARKLEDAGYVRCEKTFEGRVPRTDYRLTAEGRRALARYLDHMEALIRATRAR
ncbi:transcriptional regulator [Roseisolibacter sp. H3M3-2]|uniref:winged helix-turn-helix domain-containing protein n=1 Tax=Roseisolibacter sp. H3M3-2 TaxID=3031323 RepID=UPI0023DC2A83|nr:transcriptional regulator [Roseisolibacter sp. H3M3-2]MDF1504433.1 transcriptional regulator [Roseisolibacter sp. H3M3-2]